MHIFGCRVDACRKKKKKWGYSFVATRVESDKQEQRLATLCALAAGRAAVSSGCCPRRTFRQRQRLGGRQTAAALAKLTFNVHVNDASQVLSQQIVRGLQIHTEREREINTHTHTHTQS